MTVRKAWLRVREASAPPQPRFHGSLRFVISRSPVRSRRVVPGFLLRAAFAGYAGPIAASAQRMTTPAI